MSGAYQVLRLDFIVQTSYVLTTANIDFWRNILRKVLLKKQVRRSIELEDQSSRIENFHVIKIGSSNMQA